MLTPRVLPSIARAVIALIGVSLSARGVGAQQDARVPVPAGAGVIVIVPDSLSDAPRTLGELLRDYVPAASVQRASGALGASASVSLRDASVVRGDDPLLVIDGIRQVSYRGSSIDVLTRRPPSVLDDLMLDDIARIEILTGPAAAASYGYDGQRGAIVVTTRAPSAGRPLVRASVTTSSSDENAGYTRNLARVTTDGRVCAYATEVNGGCSAVGTSRFTPLLDRSPFRSAQQARAHLGATGSFARFGYAASAGFERGTGTMDADAADRTTGSLRLTLPILPNVRLGLTSLATERGVSIPSEGNSSLVGYGAGGGPLDCSPATPCGSDSSSGGYRVAPLAWLEPRGPHRRIDRLGNALSLDIDATPGLSLRTTATADLFRDRAVMRDSSRSQPDGRFVSYSKSVARERNWRVGGAQEARLAGHVGTVATATRLAVRFESERSRETRESRSYSPPIGPFPGGAAGASAGSGLYRNRLESSLDQRFSWSDRASLGVGVIHTSTKWWKGIVKLPSVIDPHADAMYEVIPAGASLGALTSLRVRTAYGQTSGHDGRADSDVRVFDYLVLQPVFGPMPPPRKFTPDRSSEIEAGFDAAIAPAAARVSVTAFRRHERIENLFMLVVSEDDANAHADRRVAGGELVAEATPIDMASARLHLRGKLAITRDRVHRGERPVDLAQSAGVMLAVADGESWGAWRRVGYTWDDANGNGRIEWPEISTTGMLAPGGRSRPSRFAALAGDLELAHAFTLTAQLDHVGGFDSYDLTSAVQCGAGVCPALNDPGASLSDQARALLAHGRTYSGFIVPGDATSLRELSLTWHSPTAAARLRANSLRVTLSAYDVASWTRSKGIHPETDLPGLGDQNTLLQSLVQPIPRTFGLRVALTY